MQHDRSSQLPVRTGVAVVGGGISGLALGFHLQRRGVDVHVFEAQARPGGNIRSEVREGFLCEWGPNGWLDNEPATARLVEALGLQGQLVHASELASVRWIVRDGALRALPTQPLRFLGSDVLSLGGRLRVLLEWAQPARRDDADEAVFDFAARRIGREAAEILVDAMVTGIYAGDSRRLSLQSAFPRMYEMERLHGGLFRAMRAMRRTQRRRQRDHGRPQEVLSVGERHDRESARGERRRGGPLGPGGTLTSFANGMETVVHALSAALGERLHLGMPVQGLAPVQGMWELALAGGRQLVTERVVLASPAWAAAPLLAALDAELAALVAGIPSAPVTVVCLGFAEGDLAQVERGFGFLVPGREKLPILGTLFDTWVFPNRSRPGQVLFRTMIGGARDPGAVEESDEKLVDRALSSLEKLLRLRASPGMVLVVRHPRGIPQYPVGHAQRLARIDAALARYPGLVLTGNSYRGIAMNSCIKEAEVLAGRLATELAHQP